MQSVGPVISSDTGHFLRNDRYVYRDRSWHLGRKVILLNEQGEVVAAQTEKLTVSRPHPLWSEQDPEQWWQATDRAMKALGVQHSLQDVKALGIAGQMHGATLLDAQQRVLRPAILWNDGRCAQSALCWKREFRNRG